jgi:hypothetical protein
MPLMPLRLDHMFNQHTLARDTRTLSRRSLGTLQLMRMDSESNERVSIDEKALIHILANKDSYQIAMIRQVYHQRHKRNLETDVASEVSGHFEDGNH